MKLWTIWQAPVFTITLALVVVPAWSAKANPASDLQKLLTTNRCEGCDLSGVNLIGIDLSNAQLQGAKLNAANLSGADLSGANLTKVSAVGTSFMGANLQKTTLVKASLIYANLAKAQLNDAILQGTDLQGANLVGADLNGAKITESDFVGANLAEIKRSQSWLDSDRNRFQGDTRVMIDSKPSIIEKEIEPSSPIVGTPPPSPIPLPDGDTGVTGSSNNNVLQGGRGRSDNPDRINGVVRPVTRGGRDSRIESRRRPQKMRRRFSIPAWVGFTQTSTTGGGRYHNPDHPDSILELW
jgi:Pentapeptide repeats (8 copies)